MSKPCGGDYKNSIGTWGTDSPAEQHDQKVSHLLTIATVIVNVILFTAKVVASVLSGSLSIISSSVDSAVDISSSAAICLTQRAIKKRDPYVYPRGRTRLEPIAIIIVSVIMGVASLQMIVHSVESIIKKTVDPHVDYMTIGIMVFTIISKFVLMIICLQCKRDASIALLCQDNRNDCISNVVAGICAYLGSKVWIYLDPIGAIIVSIYIASTWFVTGKEHLIMLSGCSAKPEFYNRIVKASVEHDERIKFIDTVLVYHYGMQFLVEVHLVFDPLMILKTAHDISESLQVKLESFPEVERAFVHSDYEFTHVPSAEHKVV